MNVRLTLQTLHGALALPTIAVNQGPKGPFAYVIENDTAVVRTLVIDVRQDEITTVKSGVQPGDAVVTEGQGSLRAGAKVSIRRTPISATGTTNATDGSEATPATDAPNAAGSAHVSEAAEAADAAGGRKPPRT